MKSKIRVYSSTDVRRSATRRQTNNSLSQIANTNAVRTVVSHVDKRLRAESCHVTTVPQLGIVTVYEQSQALAATTKRHRTDANSTYSECHHRADESRHVVLCSVCDAVGSVLLLSADNKDLRSMSSPALTYIHSRHGTRGTNPPVGAFTLVTSFPLCICHTHLIRRMQQFGPLRGSAWHRRSSPFFSSSIWPMGGRTEGHSLPLAFKCQTTRSAQ